MSAPSYSGLTVATDTTITATWGDMVRDSVINVFASAAARDSAITAPTEGMFAYLKDSPKRLTYYNGSKWLTLVSRVKATHTDFLNTTTLSAVTGMTIPVDANSTYEFDLMAMVFGGQGIGCLLALQIPSGATLDAQVSGWTDSNGSQFVANVSAATGNAALGSNGWGYNASINRSATIARGILTVGSTAGNAVLLGAQRVASSGSASYVDTGSWMELRQVA